MVEHHVCDRRAAQRLAAAEVHLLLVHRRLRLHVKVPVVLGTQQLGEGPRHLRTLVARRVASGLDQQHPVRRVGAQPIGEHAARGAASNDDVVKLAVDRRRAAAAAEAAASDAAAAAKAQRGARAATAEPRLRWRQRQLQGKERH